MLWHSGNVMNEPQAGGTEAPARIPVFMLGSDDGIAIREMIERQQCAETESAASGGIADRTQDRERVGRAPGATAENVVVMAHTEAFFEGAMDNASGVGTMIELAEYHARVPKAERASARWSSYVVGIITHRPARRRASAGFTTIARTSSEDRADRELAATRRRSRHISSATAWRDRTPSARGDAVLWAAATRWKKIVATTFKNFGIAIHSRPEARPGGELGNVYMDAPSVHVIDHTIYHTDLDVPLLVPEPGLRPWRGRSRRSSMR